MSEVIKLIHEMPSKKGEIKRFSDTIIASVMDGDSDPLDMAMRINAIEKIIKEVKANPDYQAAILDHADMWQEKTFAHAGAEFTKTESSKYDYSLDAGWSAINTEKDQVSAKMKARETILKSIKDATEIDGVTCYPPSKKSTSIVRITFKF